MRVFFLVIVCFFLLLQAVSFSATKIVLLGDSLDRHIAEDWCAWTNSKEKPDDKVVHKWGPDSLHYGGLSATISPSTCLNAAGDSISTVHLFGSSADGPYYWDDWEVLNAQFEVRNSSFRVTKSLEVYIETFGVPDKVFFKTGNWDMALDRDFKDHSAANHYLANMARILGEIREVLRRYPQVKIGVMTCPTNYHRDTVVVKLNEQLREFAAAQSLLMYDYDADVWATTGFNFNKDVHQKIFRGHDYDVHPISLYSIMAGEKLLGHAHSAYYQPRGHRPNPSPLVGSPVHRTIPRHYRDFLVVRGVEEGVDEGEKAGEGASSGELFFLEVVNGTWHKWSGLRPADLALLHLSAADILQLSAALLDTIALMGEMPEQFLQLSPPSPPFSQKPRHQGWMTREGRPLVVAQDTQHVLFVDSIESFKHFNVATQVQCALFAFPYFLFWLICVHMLLSSRTEYRENDSRVDAFFIKRAPYNGCPVR